MGPTAVQVRLTLVLVVASADRPVGVAGETGKPEEVVADAVLDSAETSGVGVVLSNAATW